MSGSAEGPPRSTVHRGPRVSVPAWFTWPIKTSVAGPDLSVMSSQPAPWPVTQSSRLSLVFYLCGQNEWLSVGTRIYGVYTYIFVCLKDGNGNWKNEIPSYFINVIKDNFTNFSPSTFVYLPQAYSLKMAAVVALCVSGLQLSICGLIFVTRRTEVAVRSRKVNILHLHILYCPHWKFPFNIGIFFPFFEKKSVG